MSLRIVTMAIACRIFILVDLVLHCRLNRTINIMLCLIGQPAIKPEYASDSLTNLININSLSTSSLFYLSCFPIRASV